MPNLNRISTYHQVFVRDLAGAIARGGWLVLLCLALLAIQSPKIAGPVQSGSPAIGSPSIHLVAVTRAVGLYDPARGPGAAIREWTKDRHKQRPFWQDDTPALAAIRFTIEAARPGAEYRRSPAIAVVFRPRMFDARAPPTAG